MKNPDPSPSRFERLRSLFDRARSLPATEREAFVRANASDDSLAAEVLSLLKLSDD